MDETQCITFILALFQVSFSESDGCIAGKGARGETMGHNLGLLSDVKVTVEDQ